MNLNQIVTVTFDAVEHRDVLAALDAAHTRFGDDRKMNPAFRNAWRNEIDDLRRQIRAAGAGCCLAFTREQMNVLLPSLNHGTSELATTTARSPVVDQLCRLREIEASLHQLDTAAVQVESASLPSRASVQPAVA